MGLIVPRSRTVAVGGRRWLVAAFVAGAVLAGWVPSARADVDGRLTLTVAQRWGLAGTAGAWTPYTVTVRNDGPGGFRGVVLLAADRNRFGPVPADSYPVYRAALEVPAGTERTVVVYVVESAGGYRAELRDSGGNQVATAAPRSPSPAAAAVAVLSDLPGADQRIAAPLKALSRIDVALSRFGSAQEFPSRGAYLSGLNGLVIDQFNTGALSRDQLRALEDFVGLGGTLIEAGGASWRRTLQPLPAELVPMWPAATTTAPLAVLAELAGGTSSATAEVAVGEVATWAREAVVTAGGLPLVVEGAYGAGRVVELAFDPFSDPFAGSVDLSATTWGQAIARGLSGTQGGSQLARLAFGPPPAAAQGGLGTALVGAGPGTWTAFPSYLDQVLGGMPAASSPPLGLLVTLLVGYVLLVTVGTYAVLKAAGRSGLLWVAVPAVALTFTAAAYVVGFGSRGSGYQVVQVQVQRLGPGGVVEVHDFDGILSPRRGDVRVTVPANALVSSAMFLSGPPTLNASEISTGARPEVRFTNVPVWDMRPVQTLEVVHPFGQQTGRAMPIDAQLRLSQGRLRGQLVNHTARTVRSLQVVSPSGAQASLAAALAPGATAAVDVQLTQGVPGLPPGKGPAPPGMQGFVPPQSPDEALVALAASQAASRVDDLALVALTEPLDVPWIEGVRPTRSGRAVMVEPVWLESADSLARLTPSARLVGSGAAGDGGQVDAYEVDLPGGLTGRLALKVAIAPGSQATAYSVEVYDWRLRGWRPVTGQAALAAGETAPGVVRLRVREDSVGQVQMSVTALP